MPYNLTSFIIRQPRVSSVNEARTLPPYTQGTVTLNNAFTIRYTGTGSTCTMHLTGQKLTTLVNKDRSHADNLNIVMTGKTLQELVTAIISTGKYASTLQGNGSDRATISGVINQNLMSTYQVQYAKKAEYLVEADQTGKLGSATVRWTKNEFAYSSTNFQWELKSGVTPDATGLAVPLSGVTSISQGAQIVFVANADNPSFDIASLKTKSGEVLVQSAGSGIQFVNMSVLSKIVGGTLQLVINEVPAVLDQDYSVSLSDNRINFLKGITNETHVTTADTSFVSTNVIGINGVILDSIQVSKNNSPLVLNTDYYPQPGTAYQGKNMGTGRVYFTKTYTDDQIAEYVLTTESSIYGDDLIIKKNGVALSSDKYLIVFEAGFLNLNEPLFPGDVLTATYASTEFGDVTDEILAGTPASITSTVGESYTIDSGYNDTLVVTADSNTETIYLPLGTEVKIDDIITQYNEQAVYSIATKNTAGDRLVIASRTPGDSATLTIQNGSANTTLGFVTGTTATGQGSVGGEFAFTLANAPVSVSSFTAPAGGDTFILKDFNLAANYPTNSLIAIQSDLYAVDSATTEPYATLYSSLTYTSFRVSSGINDTFIFSVDGTEYTITLTAGTRSLNEICDDINLQFVNPVATVVNFNGYDRIRLRSGTLGLLGSLKISTGTANDTLGFKSGLEDTGLLNTVVKIKGTFKMDYENPILRTTRKEVNFILETSTHEKAPSGVSSLFFPSVDLSSVYKANTLIRIGTSIYTVVSSQFADNKTEVKLTGNLIAPLFTTDTIERTARPVFAEGETTLVFQDVPISDLPITIKNNGTTLVDGTDYTLNGDGTVTLSDGYKLNSSSNVTATYTVFDTVPAGTSVKLNYRFFSSLNEGSKVTASYTYYSRDQFFFDIVYQSDLAETLIAKLQEDAAKAVNPSSSGFSASSGGDPSNSDSGNETPKLLEYKHRYNEGIGYAVYSWMDTRIKALTDERGSYNGVKPGANDGYLSESDIQNVVNSSSRLYPTGYNETVPKRIPFLDGVGQNDDGSSTGGVDSSINYTTNMTTQRDTTIPAENTLIDALLALPTSGTASITGTSSISSVTFYNGTGAIPANNVLIVTVNGTQRTITFTGSATGLATSSTTIISTINAASPGLATLSGSFLRLSASSIAVGSGSANTVLGLSSSQSAYLRNTSPTYTSWLTNLNTQNTQNNTMISNLNSLLSYLDTQMQDYWTGCEQAFDEAKAHYPVVQALITATNSRITEINAALTMDVNVDSNLTTRKNTNNPARVTNLTTFLNTTSTRVSQINASLTRENLFNKRYAWLAYRADRGTGTILSIKRAVDDQAKAVEKAALAKTMSTV